MSVHYIIIPHLLGKAALAEEKPLRMVKAVNSISYWCFFSILLWLLCINVAEALVEDTLFSDGFEQAELQPPVLDAPVSPTNENPYTISGTTTPTATVRVYVNATLQTTVAADAAGIFNAAIALTDGSNTVYTTQWDGSIASDPSNTISIEYINNLSNNWSGTISQDTVWTLAGSTYIVDGDLTVASGITLTIQPGVRVEFSGEYSLIIDGTLLAQGTSIDPVVFTSGRASPTAFDWLGITVNSTAINVVLDQVLLEYAVTSLEVNGTSEVELSNSEIRNNFFGLSLANASPQVISGNYIHNNFSGISIGPGSSPLITGGNEITANLYGIYVNGDDTNAAANPQPVVTANSIYANTSYNYYATSFADPADFILDARGNWWGTADPVEIAEKIFDRSSPFSAAGPWVDYSNYLDGVEGSPVSENPTIFGDITVDTNYPAGIYEVLGNIVVPSGVTLSLAAGVEFRFMANYSLVVDGTLLAQGTSIDPVVFTSGRASPVVRDWKGITINSTAVGVVLDQVLLEYAATGLAVTDTSAVELSNSEIRNNSDGILLVNASPQVISNNYIHNNFNGIYILAGSSPLITGGNEITANQNGIYVQINDDAATNPQPVVTANSIYANIGMNYRTIAVDAADFILDAQGNWWGTVDPVAIAERIFDGSDIVQLPWVDYSGYLDGAGGNPVSENPAVFGVITVNTSYPAGIYEVLGDIIVPSGITLSLAASTEFRFMGSYSLVVDGTLLAQGSSIDPVVFTSGRASPAVSDWGGISVNSTAVNVVLDQVLLEYAAIGLTVNDTSAVEIRNSEIRNNYSGLSLSNASPQVISNNYIHNNFNGIYILAGSSPLIAGGNEITANQNGIYVWGNNDVATNPQPIATENSIYANTDYNYYAVNFADAADAVLDARGNWWGTVDQVVIAQKIHDRSDFTPSRPWVDYVGFLDGPEGEPSLMPTAVRITSGVINPYQDGNEEAVLFFSTYTVTDSVLEVYQANGTTLLYTDSQNHPSPGQYTYTWDGRDQFGNILPDDIYKLVLTVTDGSSQFVWDPAATGVGSGAGSIPLAYNTFQNEYWKVNYDMETLGLIRMRVTHSGGDVFYPINLEPYDAGNNLLAWDGRDSNGDIVSGDVNIYFSAPQDLKPNAVVVKGAKPTITGNGLSPNIEVKSDPYYIIHSYDQFTNITYRIDQDSSVTFKLLPPGISDPADPAAIVLLADQAQSAKDGLGEPLDHVVEWLGYDLADTNNIQVAEEGAYTFSIEATSVASGQSSLYRGVVQIGQ